MLLTQIFVIEIENPLRKNIKRLRIDRYTQNEFYMVDKFYILHKVIHNTNALYPLKLMEKLKEKNITLTKSIVVIVLNSGDASYQWRKYY